MKVYVRNKDKKWNEAEDIEILKKVSDNWYKLQQQTPKTKIKGQWKEKI